MKRGPKGPVELSPLVWTSRSKGVDRFRLFCQRYLVVPRGKGAGKPLKLRDWQVEALRGLFEGDSKIHLICIPRGNGKTALIASAALFHLLFGGDGARVMVVAQNDLAARRLLGYTQRLVELNPELEERCQVYKDRIEVPGTGSSMVAVASEQSAVEGEDLTLAIVDELGFTDRSVFEAALLSLKREGSKLVGIGTPSLPRMLDKSPFLDLVKSGRAGDPDISLVEYGCPAGTSDDDWAAIEAANPALGDFLDPASVRAQMPPKTSRSEWRRARMGMWLEQSGESFLPADAWGLCARRGVQIPAGSRVVLGLDGSRRWDATVLVMASVSRVPHLQIVGWWFGDGDPDFRVSHEAVEKKILELSEQYRVAEVSADPWGWSRSLQVLEDAGLRVSEFPQTGTRMPKALQEMRSAALDGKLTHSDDHRLNKHVLAAQMVERGRGIGLDKPGHGQHIDGAVAATIAHSRALWLGSKKLSKRARSFKR